jgi:hypothetical protein
MQPIPTATTLPDGYSAVPAGHIATVVISPEMLAAPSPAPKATLPAALELRPLDRSTSDVYRTLFVRRKRRVMPISDLHCPSNGRAQRPAWLFEF